MPTTWRHALPPKEKMDAVMDRVYVHSNTWRYSFNAGKSAVLIFGESQKERRVGSQNRVFKLGTERVKEKLYYDHVGVKTCVLGDTHVRTEEKIVKARKALNMATAMGIKRGGLNMNTCNLIYWTVVIPTLCFGSEIWVLKKKDVEQLQAFQRYAARRLQRFHPRSINCTCFALLGWMDIIMFIKACKIIFLRSIFVMEVHTPIRRVLVERVNEFQEGTDNLFDSPIIQVLEYCVEFDLFNEIKRMAEQGHMWSKERWKQMVWEKAWQKEGERWNELKEENRFLDLINLTMEQSGYSIWWILTDYDRQYVKQCEIMVKLLCHTSMLKSDDSRLRRKPFGSRMCNACDLASPEDARHMVMGCPAQTGYRTQMFDLIGAEYGNIREQVTFSTLLGEPIQDATPQEMWGIWIIACKHIACMYWKVMRDRIDLQNPQPRLV